MLLIEMCHITGMTHVRVARYVLNALAFRDCFML